jgi:hypothetical protein
MGARYPDQVGEHKPCVPVVVVGAFLSPFGTVFVLPRRWRMSRVDIGATHDLAQRGVGRSGRESVMAVDWFCQNAVGPPEWEHEAMGSVVWVQCTNLSRVYKLSIAASSVMDTVCTRSHRSINTHNDGMTFI